jgi:hypothetical protein
MSSDELLTRALEAHQRRENERETARLEHQHQQQSLAQAFVSAHEDGWNAYVAEKLLGSASDPAAHLTWWVFGESLAEYTMTDATPPGYEQNRGHKPKRFRVGAYITGDAVLSLEVEQNGVPRGVSVNIDGHEPQRVDDLADLGSEVARMRDVEAARLRSDR